jgi:hypothetical protein
MAYSLDGLRTTFKEHINSAKRNILAGNTTTAKLDLSYAKANLMKIYDITLELDQVFCDTCEYFPEEPVDKPS